jgi:hypothetical protein
MFDKFIAAEIVARRNLKRLACNTKTEINAEALFEAHHRGLINSETFDTIVTVREEVDESRVRALVDVGLIDADDRDAIWPP